MKIKTVEINDERYVSVTDLLQAIAFIREQSSTRKQALELIVANVENSLTMKLKGEMTVR